MGQPIRYGWWILDLKVARTELAAQDHGQTAVGFLCHKGIHEGENTILTLRT